MLSTASSSFVIPESVLHFGVGAIAGGVGALAAYPFDYINSQLQSASKGKAKWKNGWEAFLGTVQDTANGGPTQLYKGVLVQVLGIAPEKGIKLGVNDVLASMAMQSMGGFPLWCQIMSGGIAGACQVVASSPLEVLKVGMQTSNRTLPEVWAQTGGIPGLFRGAEACVVRDVLFTAICFPLYAHWVHEGIPRK
jgi:solute carrier family 25 aspartate/glutamate transporter 12/13